MMENGHWKNTLPCFSSFFLDCEGTIWLIIVNVNILGKFYQIVIIYFKVNAN